MLDSLRTMLHQAITGTRGDSIAPIRVGKQVAKDLNEMLDKPLCSSEELEKRRAGARRLAELRSRPAVVAEVKRAPAPVMIYFEKDRNTRELVRVRELLAAHAIEPKLLDVTGDEATIAFVMREAKCERDELPAVFVGGTALGGFRALVAADTSGELKRAVFGA
jgi:glutaredoxin